MIVDDDEENLKMNKRMLTKADYTVLVAKSGEEAIEILKKSRADIALILMDHDMKPGMNGPEAIVEIRKLVPSQQIISFTIHDTTSIMRESFKAGAVDFLYKNASNEIILLEIEKACTKYELTSRTINIDSLNSSDRRQLIADSYMIGESEATFELCQSLRKVAPTKATVLILGETGTGKEVTAQALHKLSNRKAGPFIAINIGAESASLLDSTLFGHKKGTFTGAINDQKGKFQLADGGTIFLDEIGDLNLDLQVKLLRVIDQREINPIGAAKPVPVDVRIIAATHRNIPEMVARGTFREDLFFRLNTVILETKPLRERPADIEPLIGYFTEQICAANGFRRRFNHACLEIMKKHVWRGNVRGLRSVVEKHLIMADSNEVQPQDLDRSLFESNITELPTTMDEIDSHIDSVKRSHLERIVRESETYAEAARTLKVAPNRLYYFLGKFGLGNLL
jgi:DNA-binding NtrC family response regulator